MSENQKSLLELVTSATADDLTAIDAEISGIRDKVDDLNQQIQALETLRKSVDIRLNGKPARKKRTAGTNGGESGAKSKMPELTERIYDLIAKDGSMPSAVIAARLDQKTNVVASIVKRSDWFVCRSDGDVAIATN